VTAPFKRPGDVVVLLGDVQCGKEALAASEWLCLRGSGAAAALAGGYAPAPVDLAPLDLEAEVRLQSLVLDLARAGLLESAHDVADGGLAAALAESCTSGTEDVGVRVELPGSATGLDALGTLYGEVPSRVVVSVRPAAVATLFERAKAARVPATRLGVTGGGELHISAPPLEAVTVPAAEVRARREACLEPILRQG
jgi:phosphoribosylformylglycinamidine synthase